MEKLIKNALGQWALIKEELRKAPEDAPKPIAAPALTPEPAPAVPAAPAVDKHAHLRGLFDELSKHHKAEDFEKTKAVKGQIKDHVLSAPKGSIDFGVLGDLREKQHKGPSIEGGGHRWPKRAVTHQDMAEMVNHHLGDVKSIKEVHDKHGGMKAVEALMRTMGANGDPEIYSHLKFKKPGVHADLMDLVNPGKSAYDRENKRHLGVLPRTYMAGTPADPALHKKVDDTWNNIYEAEDNEWDNPSRTKAHEDAVIARGLDMFKRHHKIQDDNAKG